MNNINDKDIKRLNSSLELEHTMNLATEIEKVKEYKKEYVKEEPINDPDDKKTMHRGLVISLIFALIGIASVLTYYFIINNPTHYYKCLSKILVDKIFSASEYNEKVYKQTTNIDVNLTTDLLNSKTLSLINDTTLDIEQGVDNNKKQSYISIESKYEKEKLIDASIYLDGKDKRAYIYLEDYLDKYIELDKETVKSLSILFKGSSNKKAKKIIKKEIMNQIRSGETSKKEGYLVYTVTNIELLNKIKNVLTNLSKNDEFLNCYDDPEGTKRNLNQLLLMISNYTINDEVEIRIYAKKKNSLDYHLKELIIEVESTKIVFDMSNKTTKFNILSDNRTVLSGIYSKPGKTNKVLTLDVPNMLTFELKINNKYEKIRNIKFVDKNKATKIDKLSPQEQTKLMTELNKSKVYKTILQLAGSIDISEDSIAKSNALGYIETINNYKGNVPVPQLANPKLKYIKCIKYNSIWIGGNTKASCRSFLDDIDLDLNNGSIIYLTQEGKVVYNSVFVTDKYTCKYDGKDVSCIAN